MTAIASHLTCDILVAGGSFSAVAAALAAARTNFKARVILTESTDWLGGQATSQGVSAIDNCWFEPGASLMRENPATYYPSDYLEWIEMLWHKPADAVGEGMAPYLAGWVSREDFDPRTGAWLLEKMIEKHENILYLPMTVVKKVETVDCSDKYGEDGRKIVSVTLIKRTAANGYVPHSVLLSEEMHDWYSTDKSERFDKEVIQVTAENEKTLTVIDATEGGDIMVLSGADYTIGREVANEMTQEDTQLPEIDENGSQATVFPFCVSLQNDYDEETDQFIQNHFDSFAEHYQKYKETNFSFGKHNWRIVWTYRRIYCTGKTGMEDVNDDDVSMQNWYPGNDYPNASIYKDKTEAAAEAADWQGGWHYHRIKEAEEIAYAWYKYYQEHSPMPLQTCCPRGSHPCNMMGSGHGLSKFPYIRCGRRAVGLYHFRLTSSYLVDLQQENHNATSYRFFDSVGIGDYAVDVHPLTSSKGVLPPFEKAAPFYIPVRALASRNIRNLVVSGKNMATTYLTNSAYRLHPIEWAAGSAAGTLAGEMQKKKANAYDLLAIQSLRCLQTEIAKVSPIHWAAYDLESLPFLNGDFVVNNNRPITNDESFEIELFYPQGDYVEFWADGQEIGEGFVRKETGKIRLFNLHVDKAIKQIIAKCFDKQHELIETFEWNNPRN